MDKQAAIAKGGLRSGVCRLRLSLLGVGVVAVLAVSAPVAGAQTAATTIELTGAGSTFDAPFFHAAFPVYHRLHPTATVHYAAVGSTLGIARFSAEQVNFGASDVPMTPAEQAAAQGGPVVQVPVDLGAVTLSYNLYFAGIRAGLHLSGPVIAKMFLGQITNWDDPAIARLNPGVALPDAAITPIHRSDGSGTTYIFTNYLSSASPTWARRLGANTSISWPTGYGGTGNGGVASLVARTPGSIGYLELSYAATRAFTYASVRNRAGNFVAPTFADVGAAAAMKPNVSASNFSIVNEPGASSYPICGYSWILLYADQQNSATGAALAALVGWLATAGQKQAGANYYVPLPPNVQRLARTSLRRLVGPDGQPLPG